MRTDCNTFVDKHGNQIAELLITVAQPSEICSLMFLCMENLDLIKGKLIIESLNSLV